MRIQAIKAYALKIPLTRPLAITYTANTSCNSVLIEMITDDEIKGYGEAASFAQAAGIGCMLGAMVETKIGMAAATHLAYSHPNILYADLDGHFDLAEAPTFGGVETIDGCNYVPNMPGIGIDLDEDIIKKYLVSSM